MFALRHAFYLRCSKNMKSINCWFSGMTFIREEGKKPGNFFPAVSQERTTPSLKPRFRLPAAPTRVLLVSLFRGSDYFLPSSSTTEKGDQHGRHQQPRLPLQPRCSLCGIWVHAAGLECKGAAPPLPTPLLPLLELVTAPAQGLQVDRKSGT